MLCLTRLVARAARAFCGSRRSANTQPTLLFLNGQEDLLLVMQFGCLHHPIPPRTTPPPLRTYATPQASYPGGAGAASAGRGGQAVEDAQTRLPPTLASSIVMPQLSNSPHLYHQTHAHSLRNPTWAHSNTIEALQSKLLPPQVAQEGKDDHDPSGMLRPALQESCGVLACACAHPPPTDPIRHPTPLVTAKCLCLCMSCPVVSAALAFSKGAYVRIHS